MRVETADITYHLAEGDVVDAEYQQAFHDWGTSYLGVSLPQRLHYYKYLDNAHARALSGQPGSWADIENYTIHSVEQRQGHETIHVYSFVIGWPSDYFTEGIAVALDLNPFTGGEVGFFGGPVHVLCRDWLERGELFPIRDIVGSDNFRSGRWTYTYPQAGSFVQFLIEDYGLHRLKSLFQAVDEYDSTGSIMSTFESIYGLSLEEAERRWHEFLRSS
ncbi:MAG: hypothetical protein WBG64_07055 [Thermoanaerobaculia bacterium]